MEGIWGIEIMRNLFLCILNMLLMSLGQLLFRAGCKGKILDSLQSMLHLIFSPIILLALLIYAGSTVLWMYILSKVEMSYAYPIQSLAVPLVVVISCFIFKEPVPISRWIGLVIVIIGLNFVVMK